jgi:hypothetical protein
MLPTEVDSLIRESIDVHLKAQNFRPPRFGQRILARSSAGGGIQPAKAVSTGLVTAIQKVIENVQIIPYDDLQDALLQVFDSEFDTCAAAIRKFAGDYLARIAPNLAGSGWLDQKLEDARQARHLEIRLLTAGVLKSERNDSNRILYNSKNEPVAIIYAGD